MHSFSRNLRCNYNTDFLVNNSTFMHITIGTFCYYLFKIHVFLTTAFFMQYKCFLPPLCIGYLHILFYNNSNSLSLLLGKCGLSTMVTATMFKSSCPTHIRWLTASRYNKEQQHKELIYKNDKFKNQNIFYSPVYIHTFLLNTKWVKCLST